MSRGLGKVERAVLAALPDDGSMKSVYQLAIDVFGPWHLDKHIFNVGASKDVKLADPNDKISVRRAVVRLKRAGLVETLPCTVTFRRSDTGMDSALSPAFTVRQLSI